MRNFLVIAILMVMVAGTSVSAYAQHSRGQDRARDARRSGQILPLDRILASVSGQVPGRVLDVNLDSGRWVYRVKVLGRDGRVRLVFVDARTGRIQSVQGGR